jgi:hypothetical protein
LRRAIPRHPAVTAATTARARESAAHAAPAAPAAPASNDIQLAWASDKDGRKVHVAAVDPKQRRARAPFTCLGCGDPVVPHLGQVRRRHFSHHPGSSCPLTAPETALHLNAKERLLWLAEEAFAGRRAVTLLTRCPTCRRLAPRELAAEGDAAEAEGAVGALRADVLVRSRGRPALAIEVKVTHAVDPGKEAALAAAGVPAVELDAREEWERDAPGATEILVLRTLGFPPCPVCAAQTRAEDDLDQGGEAAAVAELERLRARGLLGPLPSRGGQAGDEEGLSEADRDALRARFRCPECGSRSLALGDRLAHHACPGDEPRPVAWRGYDGALVELAWWRRARGS